MWAVYIHNRKVVSCDAAAQRNTMYPLNESWMPSTIRERSDAGSVQTQPALAGGEQTTSKSILMMIAGLRFLLSAAVITMFVHA